MFEWRGRALVYPAIIVAGWVAGRAFAILQAVTPPSAAPALPPVRKVAAPLLEMPDNAPPAVLLQVLQNQRASGGVRSRPDGALDKAVSTQSKTAVVSAAPMLEFNSAPQSPPLHSERGLRPHTGTLPNINGPAGQDRLSLYMFGFWRPDAGRAGLAPVGQYGGSQAAIQFGYDLSGETDQGLALHGRASYAPAGNQKQIAIGLRWNRPAQLPVSIIAERRLDPDGTDRWAAFAAGGFDPQPVALGFALDGYAQAGWAGGADATGFFDAQARVMRPVLALGETQINAGAGVWAGGEDKAQRLDIGPTVAAAIPLGTARIDLRLDWRQRVAGSARPGSGVALTIATGF